MLNGFPHIQLSRRHHFIDRSETQLRHQFAHLFRIIRSN